jgi:tetratricopeptide (TPR) repeat protein
VLAAAGGVGAWWLRIGLRDPLQRGFAAYAREDWSEATARATKRLKVKPDDLEARRLLARASARLGRDSTAQTLFYQLGAASASAEDFFLLAKTLEREGRGSQAVTMLERALELDPAHAESLFELSGLYAGMDRLAEATDLAERLEPLPGWSARASARLGVLHDDQNDPARAARVLERALRLDPQLHGAGISPATARNLLARALLQIHRPAEARSQLETLLQAGPDREASWLLSRAAMQQGEKTLALAALKDARGFASDQPEAFEPAPFVGSAGCAECHPEVHGFEQAGRHARTFHPVGTQEAIVLPDHPLTDPKDPTIVHALRRRGDRIALEARIKGKELVALVDYMLGSGKHAQTPVGHDETGQIRELRFSFYAEIGGWDRSPGHPVRPHDEAGYLGELQTRDSLRRCLNCHTTNFRAALEASGPESADRGIGCERCHGPAGNHLAAVELGLSDPAIGRFKASSEARVMPLCAQCHGTRGRYLPDDNPGLIVRFQATTLTWSTCYVESRGALGCLTCHSPHRDAGDRPASFYESRCLGCHSRNAEPPAAGRRLRTPALPPGARRAVCPVNPDRDCLRCHMPPVKGAVPHTTFTDHHIRIGSRQ